MELIPAVTFEFSRYSFPQILYNLLALTTFVICSTYFVTTASFRMKLRQSRGAPPTVPYLVPFLGHTRIFARGNDTLASAFREYAVPNAAVRFKGIGFNFVLFSGASIIRKALSSNHLDWNTFTGPMFSHAFGADKEAADATVADDSGIGAKPYPGSNVSPNRRILRNQILFYSDAFSKPSMDALLPRYIHNLKNYYAGLATDEEWAVKEDLFEFLRDAIFSSAVDAFFGKNMLALSPDLRTHFWEFDSHLPFLTTGLPTWMRPGALRSRNECLKRVKRWRQRAISEIEKRPIDDNTNWDPSWGMGALRRRNKILDATGLWTENTTAATDLATMWAFSSNVVPASFWYLFEILSTKDLLSRVRRELDSFIQGSFLEDLTSGDAAKFANIPLLQSIFAETLRLHVASLVTRTNKQQHPVGDWILDKDQNVMVSSHVEHLSSQWDATDDAGVHHPSTEFWADRFLVSDKDGQVNFSVEGRQGSWIPFGFGEHMCPGRHFAKHEMILNFVIVISEFDIELLTPEGWQPEIDLSRYGLGVQQPRRKVPFRIRRRRL